MSMWNTERFSETVQNGTTLPASLTMTPEIVEVVPDAVIVQQRRHGQRVEVQGGVGVTTGSLNAAVTSDASQCS